MAINNTHERIKILVVEDDHHIRKQYGIGLPDYIFQIKFAEDGLDALRAYEAFKPDIIILDIMLPEMNGFQVLKEIRQRRQDSSTPIIMSTGISEKSEIQACAQLGISGYIVKPLKPKEIGAKILRYLIKPKKI